MPQSKFGCADDEWMHAQMLQLVKSRELLLFSQGISLRFRKPFAAGGERMKSTPVRPLLQRGVRPTSASADGFSPGPQSDPSPGTRRTALVTKVSDQGQRTRLVNKVREQ